MPPLTAAAEDEHTGGMIALVPRETDELTVAGGEPAEELHLTLAYLGDDVTSWTDEQKQAVLAGAEKIAAGLGRPTTAEVMGHAAFNPTGAGGFEPCAVYLVSGEELPDLKAAASEFDVSEHPVFLPHITAGYGLSPADLSYVGPVTFAAVRVALGPEVTDFPLGDDQPVEDAPTDETPEEGAMADDTELPDLDDALEVPDETGMPDEPQDCFSLDSDPHPATMSLLFDDDNQFVATCPDHEQEARQTIEAMGMTVSSEVPIEAVTEAEEVPA